MIKSRAERGVVELLIILGVICLLLVFSGMGN
jgi:hypothetical protein